MPLSTVVYNCHRGTFAGKLTSRVADHRFRTESVVTATHAGARQGTIAGRPSHGAVDRAFGPDWPSSDGTMPQIWPSSQARPSHQGHTGTRRP